jgi:hypothetical protein
MRDLLREAGCAFVRPGKGSHEIWHSPITKRNFPVPIGIPSRHTATPSFARRGCPRRFDLMRLGRRAAPTLRRIGSRRVGPLGPFGAPPPRFARGRKRRGRGGSEGSVPVRLTI